MITQYDTKYLKLSINNGSFSATGNLSAEFGHKISDNSQETYGVWAEWQCTNNQVIVRNDYSGYYPLFYYADKNNFIISNSIFRLLENGVDNTIDELSLSVFIRCGFFLNNNTALKHIKRIPPNCTLVWNKEGLSIKYSRQITKAKDYTIDEATNEYISLFRKAIDRFLPYNKRFVLPLSGGRDSRQILFELLRNNCKPTECITCGELRDIKVAKILTSKFNLQHKVLLKSPVSLHDIEAKNILTNLSALEHSWLMPLGRQLNDYDISFDGLGVGVYSRSELLDDFLYQYYINGEYDKIAKWLFNHVGPGEELLSLIKGKYGFISRNYKSAVELVIQELKEHSDSGNPLASFNFWNWNRNAIATNPFGIQGCVKMNYTPLMDKDLFDLVSSFTFSFVKKNEPQTIAINRAFPEYSGIPFYNQIPKEDFNERFRLLNKIGNNINTLFYLSHKSPRFLPAFIKTKTLSKNHNKKDIIKLNDVIMYLITLNRSI